MGGKERSVSNARFAPECPRRELTSNTLKGGGKSNGSVADKVDGAGQSRVDHD